jgi:hypothetical protein
MHTAYRVYNLLCTSQLALAVLLAALGRAYSTQYLEPLARAVECPDTRNAELQRLVFEDISNRTLGGVVPFAHRTLHLQAQYIVASLLASFFSPLYLSSSAADLDFDAPMARVAELLFWAYAALAHCILTAVASQYAEVTLAGLTLLCAAKCVALLLMCTSPRLSSLGTILYLASTTWTVVAACTQLLLFQLVSQVLLDMLLLVAHAWDKEPTFEVVQNARLCYLCLSTLVLHLGLCLQQ